MKGSDPVLVHPTWHTVHEKGSDGWPRCGNGRGKRSKPRIDYDPMKRSETDSDWPLCELGACKVARRDN